MHTIYHVWFILSSSKTYFLVVVLEFELRGSHLLGRGTTTLAILPALSSKTFKKLILRLQKIQYLEGLNYAHKIIIFKITNTHICIYIH
jgi:hypothetical protein